MLPDAEHALEKYLHLGETCELSEANAEAFNPKEKTTASGMPYNTPRTWAKVQEKAQINYAHILFFFSQIGQSPAKEAMCKICQKVGHYAKVCRSKYRKIKQNNDRSHNQSARFTANKKKKTNIHLVADENEVLETTPKQDIPWIDSIHVQTENNTTCSTKGCPKVQKALRRSHQVFTRLLMFPTNRMGKATGNKPKGMKFKLDTGTGVNIMPLSSNKNINPSEFYEQGKPVDGHSQYRSILKDCNGKPIQQYWIRVILGKWNNQYWRFIFTYCRWKRTHTAWTEYSEENGALHNAPKSLNSDNLHSPRTTKPSQMWPNGGGINHQTRCSWSSSRDIVL